MTRPSAAYLRGQRIDPSAISGQESAADLIDSAFLAYNGGRLREGCALFTQRMLAPDATVGMSLTGAMTPAGLGMSCLIPLMEAGFVDWLISTGANLYHDAHFGLGLSTPERQQFVLAIPQVTAETYRLPQSAPTHASLPIVTPSPPQSRRLLTKFAHGGWLRHKPQPKH